jgi:hypothetical protein
MKTWEDIGNRPLHIQIYIANFGEIPYRYHVHHIDCNHNNNDPSNLIALPRVFHRNLHSNPGFYASIGKNNLIDKKLLIEVYAYYRLKNYPLNKSFMVVFIEFLKKVRL